MTIETSVAALTASTTALITAVGVQQAAVNSAVTAFAATTSRVSTGLNLVSNTKDSDKPVSSATQDALALKQATLVSGVNLSTVNGLSLLSGQALVIARSATSLNSVAYADRANLRAASPQVDDASVVEGLGLFMFVASQAEPDDDETCFNTATGQWLLQAPAWELIDAWALHEAQYVEDWREDEPVRFAAYLANNI